MKTRGARRARCPRGGARPPAAEAKSTDTARDPARRVDHGHRVAMLFQQRSGRAGERESRPAVPPRTRAPSPTGSGSRGGAKATWMKLDMRSNIRMGRPQMEERHATASTTRRAEIRMAVHDLAPHNRQGTASRPLAQRHSERIGLSTARSASVRAQNPGLALRKGQPAPQR